MVRSIACIIFSFLVCVACKSRREAIVEGMVYADTIPSLLKGDFTDDYNINYTINDSSWIQHKGIVYHIITWNVQQQYIIARNDTANPGDGGRFTRIDYMLFDDMLPYRWGFCLTNYAAASAAEAEADTAANRANPRKGCNGFPFSRMKRAL